MKTILGIGNALTDILAILPDDSFLEEYNIPKGVCSTWTKKQETKFSKG